MIHTAGKQGIGAVAILLDKEVAKSVTKVDKHSDRLIVVKVQAEPVDMVIIQVYMPTTGHDENEIEEMYECIEKTMDAEKGNDNLVIMGDWNAVIGEGKDGKEVGKYGLGNRNERGVRFIELCKQRKMVVANNLFKHEKRRRYTWKRPGNSGRYQLDYILVRQRYRNSVKNACSYPGADADTDHNLVIMTAKVKLKKLKKGKKIMKWNLDILNINYKGFQEIVKEHIVTGGEGVDIEGKWQKLKKAVLQSAESEIGYQKRVKIKKPWVTEEMLKKMDERRKWKCITNEDGKRRYKTLNNELRRETERARES